MFCGNNTHTKTTNQNDPGQTSDATRLSVLRGRTRGG